MTAMSQSDRQAANQQAPEPSASGGRRRPPGRPRDPNAEERIHDAAIDEYLERGSGGFTIDGVARRAGVGKSTVYLRWSDRDTLLIESVLARSISIEDVDTGSLRDDLVHLSCNLLRFLLDPVGFATYRLTVEAVANPAFSHVARELADRHRAAIQRVFERAMERGESISASRVDHVVECLYGAIVMKVLTRGFEQGVADDVEASCRATVDLVYPALTGDRP